jgi:hypothetical protein
LFSSLSSLASVTKDFSQKLTKETKFFGWAFFKSIGGILQGEMDVAMGIIDGQNDLDLSKLVIPGKSDRSIESFEIPRLGLMGGPFMRSLIELPGLEVAEQDLHLVIFEIRCNYINQLDPDNKVTQNAGSRERLLSIYC